MTANGSEIASLSPRQREVAELSADIELTGLRKPLRVESDALRALSIVRILRSALLRGSPDEELDRCRDSVGAERGLELSLLLLRPDLLSSRIYSV